MTRTPDELAFDYQETGNSEELIKRFQPFLLKYHALIVRGKYDLKNKDIRHFICLYIGDKNITESLRKKGKYHKDIEIKKAQQAVEFIQQAYIDYHKLTPGESFYPYDDVYLELAEAFLETTKLYTDKGKGFEAFIKNRFKYILKKKYIDPKLFGFKNHENILYKDIYYCTDLMSIEAAIEKKFEDKPFNLEFNEYDNLNNILWLNGLVCGELFKNLSYTERFILVKRYQDKLSAKEIAQLTGFHHRSVARIAKKLKDYFRTMRLNGEIKWIR